MKESICPICNKQILINKRANSNKTKCNDCKKCKTCNQYNCPEPNICKKYRVFNTLIKYFNFDKSKLKTKNLHKEYKRIRNILINHYYNEKLSLLDISKKYNYPDSRNLNKVFHSLEIDRRSFSEAGTNFYLNNDTLPTKNCYKYGWHTTWDNKKVFLRSSYEFNYAKILDEQKIKYLVEHLRIPYWNTSKQKNRIAIPDFYIPESNTIIEIKSLYILKVQNDLFDKVKEYKKRKYKVKLIINNIEISEHKLKNMVGTIGFEPTINRRLANGFNL